MPGPVVRPLSPQVLKIPLIFNSQIPRMKKLYFTKLIAFIFCCCVFNNARGQFSLTNSTYTCPSRCDGSINAQTPSGTYHYRWNTGDTTSALNGLCPGNYYCIFYDSVGTQVDSIFDSLPPELTLELIPYNPLCAGESGGVIVPVVSGIYSLSIYGSDGYHWSAPNSGLSPFPDNDSAGTFTFTLIDGLACRVSRTVTLVEPPPISIAVTSVAQSTFGANNGGITTSVTNAQGPTYYTWSDNVSTGPDQLT